MADAVSPMTEKAGLAFKHPWGLVIVLTAVFAYSFLDSTILFLLVDPIKHSLLLSDEQIGVLLGFGFAGFYALGTLPAGYLVDRFDRRVLIALASVVWTLMTLICAASSGFPQIFLGRAGVGLAEAMVIPASFSLIRDAVDERFRGMAFSFYAMSPILGASVALIGGGALLHAFNLGLLSWLGPLSGIDPWRAVMCCAGLLGLPLSLLLLTVREPARKAGGPSETMDSAHQPVLAHIRNNLVIYTLLIAYVSFGAMMAFGQGAWLPTMLGRKWVLPPERIGPMVGGLNLLCGLTGLAVTSLLLRRLAASGRNILVFGAVAALLSATGLAGAALAPSLPMSLACGGFGQFFVGVSFPVGATILSQLAPERFMGRISAIYLLFQTLLGQSLGPLLIATSASIIFGGADHLAMGFLTMMALFGIVAAASALGLRHIIARDGLNRQKRRKNDLRYQQ